MSHPHPPHGSNAPSGNNPSGFPTDQQYDPYGSAYLARPAQAPQKAGLGLILAVVGLSLALVGVVIKIALPSDPPAPAPVTGSLVTPDSPANDEGRGKGKDPKSGSTAHGPGWVMDIAKGWRKVDVPTITEDAAWRTGGGSPGFPTTLAILPEPSGLPMTLSTYVAASAATLNAGIAGTRIISSETLHAKGHEYGRIEYTATISGIRVHNVAFLVETSSGGFVAATLSTSPEAFKKESAKLERYLTTLRAA